MSGSSTNPCPPLLSSSCLACGFHAAIPLFDGGSQPLATLGWPDRPEDSLNMPRLRLDFIRCLRCGHIYNRAFEYQQVPYVKHPNLMYNDSTLWQWHQEQVCLRLAALLPEDATVIEIGCGEGGFLKQLARLLPQGNFIGFDPNNKNSLEQKRLTLKPELFVPEKHLKEHRPDLILSRHVLEHLINPLAFIQELAFYSSWYKQQPRLFFEVPCVDRILSFGRLEDLYYEHNSHFTQNSFTTMLKSLPCQIDFIETGYNAEVIFGLIQLEAMPVAHQIVAETQIFTQQAEQVRRCVPEQIAELLRQGKKLALWGGTGKGAAFVHHFQLDADQFPMTVVDSDLAKAGTYVPGSAYRIWTRERLNEQPVDVILIPAQWRAQDIVIEIKQAGIPHKRLLLEHAGGLVDFESGEHPYRILS